MDISLVIRHRLEELGLEQRDLARAAQVTESYISQLLARKKAPPSPDRTDIYAKLGKLLKLPNGELAKLAELRPPQAVSAQVQDSLRVISSRPG
jgi:transcriptional regulator with XRE-family HTH domain